MAEGIEICGNYQIFHKLLLCSSWFLFFFQSADFKILPSSYGHARDAYAFGTMVESLLTVLNDQGENDTFVCYVQTHVAFSLHVSPKTFACCS